MTSRSDFSRKLSGIYEAVLEKSPICHPQNCQQEHESYAHRLSILSSCRNDWDNLRFLTSVPVNKAKRAKNVTLGRTLRSDLCLKTCTFFSPKKEHHKIKMSITQIITCGFQKYKQFYCTINEWVATAILVKKSLWNSIIPAMLPEICWLTRYGTCFRVEIWFSL